MGTAEFPILKKSDLDAEQRALWDELTLGPRGFYTGGPEAERLPDLYNAWLQFPAFGRIMLRLGDALRACTELSGRLRELVILTTSVELGARVEYEFHVPFARNEGLSEALISAIGAGETPAFGDDAERVVYVANLQLLRSATLDERTREDVVRLIGHRGMIQLVGAIGLYVVTAHTTNVARVQLAEDFSADPEKLKAFFSGKTTD